MGDRFKVGVRIRPPLEKNGEKFDIEATTKFDDITVILSNAGGNQVTTKRQAFQFDHTWDKDGMQEEIYEEAVVELVDDVLEGVNATTMCYGQTGSGKTFTALGVVNHNPLSGNDLDLVSTNTGLYLRIIKDLLLCKQRKRQKIHIIISLSVLEIYNEQVRDLLSNQAGALQIVMSDDEVFLPNLTEVEITDLNAAYQYYKLASNKRSQRSTQMNDTSSRSHALFLINVYRQEVTPASPVPPPASLLFLTPDAEVESASGYDNSGVFTVGGDSRPATPAIPTPKGKTSGTASRSGQSLSRSQSVPVKDEPRGTRPKMENGTLPRTGPNQSIIPVAGQPNIFHSRFALVDLAGSEKVKHSKVTGDAFQEMICINKSLTALGNVVHALYTAQKHVPFRDSKLTSILRPNFVAGKVLLIANVAPTVSYFEETLSTLYFAQKVKAMNVMVLDAAPDTRPYVEWLDQLRKNEAMFAELRVCAAIHDFEPMLRRTHATEWPFHLLGQQQPQVRKDKLRQAVAEYRELQQQKERQKEVEERDSYSRTVQEMVMEFRQRLQTLRQKHAEADDEYRQMRSPHDPAVALQERLQQEEQHCRAVADFNSRGAAAVGQKRTHVDAARQEELQLLTRIGDISKDINASHPPGTVDADQRRRDDKEWEWRTKLHDTASEIIPRLVTFYREVKVPVFQARLANFDIARSAIELSNQVAVLEDTTGLGLGSHPCESPEAWEKYFREMGRKAACKVGDASLWNVPEDGPRIFHGEFRESLKRLGKQTIAVRWLPHVPYQHLRPPGGTGWSMKSIIAAAIKGHRSISPLGGFCLQVTVQPQLLKTLETAGTGLGLNPNIVVNPSSSRPAKVDVTVPDFESGQEQRSQVSFATFLSDGLRAGLRAEDLDEKFLLMKNQSLAHQIADHLIPTTGRQLQKLIIPKSANSTTFLWDMLQHRNPIATAPFQYLNLNTGSSTQIWFTFTPKQADNQVIYNVLQRIRPGYRDGDRLHHVDILVLAAEVKLPVDILIQPPGWMVVLEPGRWRCSRALQHTCCLKTHIAIHAIGQIRALRDHMLVYKHTSRWPILWMAVRLMKKLKFNSPVMVTLMREIVNFYSSLISECSEKRRDLEAQASLGEVTVKDSTADFDSDSGYQRLPLMACASCSNLIQVLAIRGCCLRCFQQDVQAHVVRPPYDLVHFISQPMLDWMNRTIETAQILFVDQSRSGPSGPPTSAGSGSGSGSLMRTSSISSATSSASPPTPSR
eukprot:TRINITY_DN12767_c0_g1_i1.p1 TRINITY_DN12767_c0_g1~~TRINITY_DN12767_c0_g1_i1.p1  ORF type:complete len:1244 (-),score=235.26 TRINITY_DN12767_c0_g1_i1:474-4205(-)